MSGTATPVTTTRWAAILLILFAGSVGAAQLGKLPGALPELRADLNIGLVTAGWLISTIVATGALFSIAAGMFGDRVGHRRILLTSVLLVAGGSLAGAGAESISILIASRVVEGFGYIGIISTAPVIIARVATDRDRPIAFGVWSFYMPLGMATMVAMSPLLMELFGGWRGLWAANAALALIGFALLYAVLRGARYAQTPGGTKVGLRDIWRTVSRPAPWVVGISMGAYSLVYLSSMAFLPTYMVEERGMAADTAALLIGLAIFMNAPGCFAGGWMMKRNVPAWAGIAAGYAGMAVCAFGLYQADIPFGLRYTLALALPFFGGFIPPIVLARAQTHAPSPLLYGTTVGLVIQMVSLGQFIGPPALAALVARSGHWQSGAWLTVGACIVGFGMAVLLRRLDRRAGLR